MPVKPPEGQSELPTNDRQPTGGDVASLNGRTGMSVLQLRETLFLRHSTMLPAVTLGTLALLTPDAMKKVKSPGNGTRAGQGVELPKSAVVVGVLRQPTMTCMQQQETHNQY